MSDLYLLVEIVAGTTTALALPLLAAEVVEHRAGLATGWREGCAQLAVWWAQVRRWPARGHRALDAAEVLLLSVLLRAHGEHRGQCDSRREVTT